MDDRINVLLCNIDRGGLSRPSFDGTMLERGHWDFGTYRRLFRAVPFTPHIIAIIEAKQYGWWGGQALRAASWVLGDIFKRPYVGEVGWLPHGKSGPALFYDPVALHLEEWGNDHSTVSEAERNLARLHLRAYPQDPFLFRVLHLPFWSGDARLDTTGLVCSEGTSATPTLYLGDLNSTASGLHWPQADWTVETKKSKLHKAMQLPDGTWATDTRVLDNLTGRYDENTKTRTGGTGFHAIPELAAAAGQPGALIPTINYGIDPWGGLLVDMGLLNNVWRDGFVAGSFFTLAPSLLGNGGTYDSDHRATGWTVRVPTS